LPSVAAFLLVTLLILAAQVGAADNDAAARPPELTVLDRWVGEWDMEAQIKSNAFFPAGSKSTFKATIRWAINDRFVRCEADGSGSQGERKFKDAFSWVCTWDPNSKTYVSVVFWANVAPGGDAQWGGGDRATGTWDEAAKTLTTRSGDLGGGMRSKGVTKWIDADHHEFVTRLTDANGKLVMEMAGKAARRK
jgi:hypothetical protein